jgi:hypothetical protein
VKTLTAAALVLGFVAQAGTPSPREVLELSRPLTGAEVETVLAASRGALSGKMFRLSRPGLPGGPEFLMGRDGHPTIERGSGAIVGGVVGGLVSGSGESTRPVESHFRIDTASVIHYTGLPARRCNGNAGEGDLVVEYERWGSRPWTATARVRDARDFGGLGFAPLFEILQGTHTVTSVERARIGGRWARAFVSEWTPLRSIVDTQPASLAGDPIPNVAGVPLPENALQTLWIDSRSLLPVRWETRRRGRVVSTYDFEYRRANLRLPPGVRAPGCIQ